MFRGFSRLLRESSTVILCDNDVFDASATVAKAKDYAMMVSSSHSPQGRLDVPYSECCAAIPSLHHGYRITILLLEQFSQLLLSVPLLRLLNEDGPLVVPPELRILHDRSQRRGVDVQRRRGESELGVERDGDLHLVSVYLPRRDKATYDWAAKPCERLLVERPRAYSA